MAVGDRQEELNSKLSELLNHDHKASNKAAAEWTLSQACRVAKRLFREKLGLKDEEEGEGGEGHVEIGVVLGPGPEGGRGPRCLFL